MAFKEGRLDYHRVEGQLLQPQQGEKPLLLCVGYPDYVEDGATNLSSGQYSASFCTFSA